MNKRLKEIALRSKEIENELNSEEVTKEGVEALSVELDELISEREKLVEKDKELRSRVEELSINSVGTDSKGQRKSEVEKRAEEFAKTGRATIEITKAEIRALTVASGSLAQPIEVAGINDMFPTASTLLDHTNVEDLKELGTYRVAYQTGDMDAEITTEGEEFPEGEAEFKYIEVTPVKIAIYTEIAREVTKLTPLNYYEKVRSSVINALRKKTSRLIITGDSNAAPKEITGIINAEALEAPALEIASIDENTLKTIVMNYGGDESLYGANVLVLNKADLLAFGKIRGTDKKAVYDITPDASNPNTGIIKEGGIACRYIINSGALPALSATATAGGTTCMIYGNLLAYTLGIFSEMNIEVSTEYQFRKKMIAVTGEVMIGGNVTSKDGFIKVNKSA